MNDEQRVLLGDAIVDIALMLGICDLGRCFTGPEVLQLAADAKIEIGNLKRKAERASL